MRFEKKVTYDQSRAIGLAFAVLFFFDPIVFLYNEVLNPSTYLAINEAGAKYDMGMAETFHIFDGTCIAIIVTILSALYIKNIIAAGLDPEQCTEKEDPN